MEKKIKVIIADDNQILCSFIEKYVKQIDYVELLGSAYTDEEEIRQIETLKPDVVITDLMRDKKYTGLDIIRSYKGKEYCPKFLVISADYQKDVYSEEENLPIYGYIKKPFFDYDIIKQELEKIRDIIAEEKTIL